MARVTNTSEKIVVDENGVIKHTETDRTTNWGTEPNYVKLYLDDILYLSDLPKGLNSVLYSLIKRMHYGNELVINAALKRQIGKELGLSVGTINNAITKFVKGKLLERMDTGLYLVNPHLFGKGEWKENAKIRLVATYDLKGRTIMAEIDRDEPSKEVKSKETSSNIDEHEFDIFDFDEEPSFDEETADVLPDVVPAGYQQ